MRVPAGRGCAVAGYLAHVLSVMLHEFALPNEIVLRVRRAAYTICLLLSHGPKRAREGLV